MVAAESAWLEVAMAAESSGASCWATIASDSLALISIAFGLQLELESELKLDTLESESEPESESECTCASCSVHVGEDLIFGGNNRR